MKRTIPHGGKNYTLRTSLRHDTGDNYGLRVSVSDETGLLFGTSLNSSTTVAQAVAWAKEGIERHIRSTSRPFTSLEDYFSNPAQ